MSGKIGKRGPGRAMRITDLLHRWTGGLVGLFLAVLGLSGTILLHEDVLVRVTVPHAADSVARDDAGLIRIMGQYAGDPASGVRTIRFADEGLGVHLLTYKGEGRGAYVDQAGVIVTRWGSEWQQPEVWLFDLHHHLFAGETGTIIVGILRLAGFGFVVTGILLWWRTRSTFEFRLLPKRTSRPAIVRHHRDLGIVMAPLLLVSFVTGMMMTLKPVEALLITPFAQAKGEKPPKPDKDAAKVIPAKLDLSAIVMQARARFPDAQIRWIGLPSAKQPRFQLRMRQPGEWPPNDRSVLLFDADSRLVDARAAVSAPRQVRIKNAEYPVHTGEALPYLGKWLLTLSGLALTLLGTLAVWTFWSAPTKVRLPVIDHGLVFQTLRVSGVYQRDLNQVI